MVRRFVSNKTKIAKSKITTTTTTTKTITTAGITTKFTARLWLKASTSIVSFSAWADFEFMSRFSFYDSWFESISYTTKNNDNLVAIQKVCHSGTSRGWGGGGLTKKTHKVSQGGRGGRRVCSQVRFWVMSITQSFSALIFSASQFLLFCVCVRACVRLRPSIVKALSIWGWNSRGEINDVVLKTFLSSAKYLHRYFSMKHRAVLTGRFILFTI